MTIRRGEGNLLMPPSLRQRCLHIFLGTAAALVVVLLTLTVIPWHSAEYNTAATSLLLYPYHFCCFLFSGLLAAPPPTPASLSLQKFAATTAPRVLNVHVIPHTHDDVGWRKTVEQYYAGLNETIDTRGRVRDIITTTIAALLEQPARTFSWTESKFLHMWWTEMAALNRTALHDSLRYLIAVGQWTFVNGGWCMHDEAGAHYMGMMDQTTLGHDFLQAALGVVPTVGWQLDPFGHSATQASLLTARTGFDALYFGRIDYQDLQLRQGRRACEGLWQPSTRQTTETTNSSMAKESDKNHNEDDSNPLPPVFWGLTGEYGGNYGGPPDFCFDVLCDDEPLVGANQTRLLQRVVTFVKDLAIQANQTQGNHISITMGMDFHYQNAPKNFANMDLLLSSIMQYQDWNMLDASDYLGPRFDRIQIFYSTPEYYTAQKNAETVRYYKQRNHEQQPPLWEVKHDDFYPYADCPHCYMTGYFTSRTAFKRLERVASAFLLAARQVDSLPPPVEWEIKHDDFFPYADCPHCYWTGYFTSRTAFKRLERVASAFLLASRQVDSLPAKEPPVTSHPFALPLCDCAEFVATTTTTSTCQCTPPLYELEDALGVAQHHDGITGTGKQHVADDYSKRVQAGLTRASRYMAQALKSLMLNTTHASDTLSNLMFCQLLNETKCAVSQQVADTDDLYVIVYNPIATERSTNVRLPVSKGTDAVYQITSLGDRRGTQVVTPVLAGKYEDEDAAQYVLVFGTGLLPPVGAAAFRISLVNTSSIDNEMQRRLPYTVQKESESTFSVLTDSFKVFFDLESGSIQKISNGDVELPVEQQWGYYEPFDSRIDYEAEPRENSGAYIFRPATPKQDLILVPPQPTGANFVQTSVGVEVHMQFEQPWIQQITRVSSDPWVEIEYTVGPLPIEEGRGKEVVSRFLTSIQNDGVFYTDSNAREFQKRVRDYRPTWSLQVNEPIAGNYYPVTAAIFMQDKNASFSILTDRSRGGSSILDGSLEVMVQRRTVADDHRGVDEPMNETVGGMTPYPPYGEVERIGDGVIVKGVHRIVIGKGSSGADISRSVMDGIFAEPLVFVGSSPVDDIVSFAQPSFSVLGRALPLPPNVMLTTLKRIRGKNETTLLLRLGHQYGVGESLILSRPVKVNLSLLLAGHYEVLMVTEKTLSGNQNLSHYLKRRYNWTNAEIPTSAHTEPVSTTITLKPMEIRTFVVEVKEKKVHAS